MEKLYFTIGEILKILNISEGTIRNYEKKGLITSKKQACNHYRRFDYRDLNRIASVRKYRNWELPLSDIKNLLRSETPMSSQKILQEHREKLYEEARRLLENVEKMDLDIDKIERAEKNLDKFTIVDRPSFCFYSFDDIIKDKSIVSENAFDEYASIIKKEEFYGTIKPVFGCVKAHQELLPECGTIYPERTCVYTVLKVEPFHAGIKSYSEVLEKSQEYIKQHHYTLTDDILGVKLFTLQQEEKQRDYYEIYIPVENPDAK